MEFDLQLAISFALLASPLLLYDTLDVVYKIWEDIFPGTYLDGKRMGAFLATFFTYFCPLSFLCAKGKAYLAAWPIFGTTNQLLASLVLLSVVVWLVKTGKKSFYAVIPMILMMAMTLWSLLLMIIPFLKTFPTFEGVDSNGMIAGISGIVLFILSMFIIVEAFNVLVIKKKRPGKVSVQQS